MQKVIDKQRVAQISINEKSRQELEQKKKEREEFKKKNPLLAELMVEPDEDEGKLADGFVRSKRNLAMRVRDTLDLEMDELEQSKVELIQKLN